MKIETERLEIRLLNPEHLALWLDDLPRLEQEFTCRYRGRTARGRFPDDRRNPTRRDLRRCGLSAMAQLLVPHPENRPHSRRLGDLQGSPGPRRLCRNRLRTWPRLRTQRLHDRGRRSSLHLGLAAGRRPAHHRRNGCRRIRLAADPAKMRIPGAQPRRNLPVDPVSGFPILRRLSTAIIARHHAIPAVLFRISPTIHSVSPPLPYFPASYK